MRPRPHAVALLVASVLGAIGSLVVMPVATDGPDGAPAPADAVRAPGGVVDAARPAGGRVVSPALLLAVVLPAVAGAVAVLRRHAGVPAVVRAAGPGTRPRPVDGRAPPPRVHPLAR